MQLLAGVRFADFTWAGAGSFATKFFADLGAEVIKIESSIRPDPVRVGRPFKDGKPGLNRSGYFASRNTGKKSITLNMKSPDAMRVVRRLIAQSDVVSNNFGPGVMEKWGLGYEEVKKIKPDIIYLSMPMYGMDGPYRNLLGVGKTISAVTGLHHLTGFPGTVPVGPGTHYPDHAPNPYHAAFAVMAALIYRRTTGKGQQIELAQVESTLNVIGPAILEYTATGREPCQWGNHHPVASPHNVFPCRGDDSWCAIAVFNDEQWNALCDVAEEPTWLEDERFSTPEGRVKNREQLENLIAQWTMQQDAEEITRMLQGAGVPAAVVADVRYLVEKDPQLQSRGHWVRLDHPEMGETLYNAPPFHFDGRLVNLQRPPLLGEHTEYVLKDLLGFSAEEIERLAANGVLQ